MGGMGGSSGPRPGAQGFNQQWQYQSTINPEELFRKIFGDAGFGRTGGFDDFAESNFGFGEAQEVSLLVIKSGDTHYTILYNDTMLQV